jgi:hypothetical protein
MGAVFDRAGSSVVVFCAGSAWTPLIDAALDLGLKHASSVQSYGRSAGSSWTRCWISVSSGSISSGSSSSSVAGVSVAVSVKYQ